MYNRNENENISLAEALRIESEEKAAQENFNDLYISNTRIIDIYTEANGGY